MITIRIGNRRYRGLYSWSDITLKQFSQLAAVRIPERYRQWALADGKYDPDHPEEFIAATEGITEEDINTVFPAFYREVILTLTNIPGKALDKLSNEQVEDMYNTYLRHFVFSLIYKVPLITFMGQIVEYKPEDIRVFRIGLRHYFLPRSVNVGGEIVTLYEESAAAYTEASDIFASMQFTAEDVSRFGLFLAIYCRRFRESYSEKKALRRQHTMQKATMNIVWSVFFYTLRPLPAYFRETVLSGVRQRRMQDVRSEVLTWRNTERGRYSTKQPVTEGSAQ